MTANARLKAFIEIASAMLLLFILATALARRPSMQGAASVDQPVILNMRTLIYHCPACELVRHCGTDCEAVDIAEARRRGARPCLTCGGICLARR